MARKAKVLNVSVPEEKYMGVSLQSIRAKHKANVGAKKNIREFAWAGMGFSLIKSLIASAKGTGIPMREGLLGPLRS